jgi:uncharacterized protein YecT (DUF1311 family)
MRRASLSLCLLAVSLATLSRAHAQEAPSTSDGPVVNSAPQPAPIERQDPNDPPNAPADTPPPQPALPAPPPYDPAIFQRAIPPPELTGLLSAEGAPSGQIYRDKNWHKLLRSAMPGVNFHYGRDVSLPDTIDLALDGSSNPVLVRDNRYVILSGHHTTDSWLRKDGRAMLWIDTHDGLIVGAFFFHPSNGEPSPTVTLFTKMIKQDGIGLSQLPPAFLTDYARWQQANGISPVLINYFIGDQNKKFFAEHDADFCLYNDSTAPPSNDCDQMNADAADNDMIAASYLEQVHYATNATAWMINDPDQTSWIAYRDRTCAHGPNPISCRVVMTHERIHKIQHRPPIHH